MRRRHPEALTWRSGRSNVGGAATVQSHVTVCPLCYMDDVSPAFAASREVVGCCDMGLVTR